MSQSRRECLQRAALGGSALAVGSTVATTEAVAGDVQALPEDRVFEGTLIESKPDRLVVAVDGDERVLTPSGKSDRMAGR